jgi:hypothetical protein
VRLSNVVWLAVAAAAVVGLFAAVRAVRTTSNEAGVDIETLVSGIPAVAAAGGAAENVRIAIPAVDAYFAENGSYVGLTTDELRRRDPGLNATVTVAWSRADAACVQSTVRGVTASATRPAGGVVARSC